MIIAFLENSRIARAWHIRRISSFLVNSSEVTRFLACLTCG